LSRRLSSVKLRALSMAAAGICISIFLSSGTAGAATSTVTVGDLWFCNSSFQGGNCTTTVTAGDTVVWSFSNAVQAHTVTECGGANCNTATGNPVFDSGVVQGGAGPFQFTFNAPGTYNYYCQVHAFEMRGAVVVQPASAPTATEVTGGQTPAPGGGAAATSTPAGGTGTGLPTAGYGPNERSDGDWKLLLALAATGAGLLGIGGATLARTRAR
jgi:plastocyanin